MKWDFNNLKGNSASSATSLRLSVFTVPLIMSVSTSISDLPLPLREQIVSYISPISRSACIHPTLRHRERLNQALPLDLLAPAQSSSVLSIAVARYLGPRSRFLTRRVTKHRLADWVRALAPFVQAVSFHDTILDGSARTDYSESNTYRFYFTLGIVLREGVDMLKAVAEPLVALRVLDVACIPVYWADPVDIRVLLTNALHHNAATLRELALPVSYICVRALEQVCLPALEVAEFDFRSHNLGESGRFVVPWTCDMARMLRALQKSRGDGKGIHDLRLWNITSKQMMGMESDGLSQEFLSGVTALDVKPCPYSGEWGMVAMCASFSELRSVRLRLCLTEARMKRLMAECPHLEEIHVDSQITYADTYFDSDHEDQYLDELPRVFEAARGKLRSISLRGDISGYILLALGATNPKLENLVVDVRPWNVSSLVPLLTSQCRKLQSLELRYGETLTNTEVLGTAGWKSITEAVCGASVELRTLIVLSLNDETGVEEDVEGLMAGMCEMLKSLGDRAEKVVFNVPTSVLEYRVLFEAERRVIEAATKWCRNLQCFAVSLAINFDHEWNSKEEERTECVALLKARDKLLISAPRLHFIYLGRIDNVAEERGFSNEAKVDDEILSWTLIPENPVLDDVTGS